MFGRKIKEMLITIASGISDEGATLNSFKNAFLIFGITRDETIKRYLIIMENLGLITRKNPLMDTWENARWFKGDYFRKDIKGFRLARDEEMRRDTKEIEREIKKEVDEFLKNFLEVEKSDEEGKNELEQSTE